MRQTVGGDKVVAFVVGTYGIVLIWSGLVHGKVFDSFEGRGAKSRYSFPLLPLVQLV